MKVYIVISEPFPNGFAATNRIKCYCKSLQLAKIKFSVVCSSRFQKGYFGLTNDNYFGNIYGEEFIYPSKSTYLSGNTIYSKIQKRIDKINLIKYLYCNLDAGDVVLTYMREDPICELIIKMTHIKKAKIIRELCELPFGTTKESVISQEKRSRYLSKVFPMFDGAICISDSLLSLAKKFNPDGNYIKVPILVDEDKWSFDTIEKKELGFPYIFHSGSLYQQKDGILDVLKAFAKSIKYIPKNFKYIFTGTVDGQGADDEEILRIIHEENLEDRVLFIGYVKEDDLKSYLKGASFFIINKLDTTQNKYCFATKLGEYLMTGNPVITTDIGESMNYLVNGENSFIVPHGEIDSLVEVIIKTANNKESIMVGCNGKKLADSVFTCRSQSVRLSKYFQSL